MNDSEESFDDSLYKQPSDLENASEAGANWKEFDPYSGRDGDALRDSQRQAFRKRTSQQMVERVARLLIQATGSAVTLPEIRALTLARTGEATISLPLLVELIDSLSVWVGARRLPGIADCTLVSLLKRPARSFFVKAYEAFEETVPEAFRGRGVLFVGPVAGLNARSRGLLALYEHEPFRGVDDHARLFLGRRPGAPALILEEACSYLEGHEIGTGDYSGE